MILFENLNFKKATSNIKIQQVLVSFGLDNVITYLRDGLVLSDIGIVTLHVLKRTRWVLYIHEDFFDSHGIKPPQKLSKIIIKRNGHCLYSENKI